MMMRVKTMQIKMQTLIVVVLCLGLVQLACAMGASSGPTPTLFVPPTVAAATEANPAPTQAPPTVEPGIAASENPAQTEAPAAKGERGTADEAKAMLKLAIDHYNSVGREQALADFTAEAPPFVDRDLYVVCIDSNHIEQANGGFPQYVGVSADGITDINGVPLGQAFWDAVAKADDGSVSYRWINPVSGQMEDKTLFYHKVADDLFCGVGIYNP